MTTLLPVADAPTTNDISPSSAPEVASSEDRAAFGALVDDAIASIEPRPDRGSATDTSGAAEDTAETPDSHDEHEDAAVVPPTVTLPAALAMALPTTVAVAPPGVPVAAPAAKTPAGTEPITAPTSPASVTTIDAPDVTTPAADAMAAVTAGQEAPAGADTGAPPLTGASVATAITRDVPATALVGAAADGAAPTAEARTADATPSLPGREEPAAPPIHTADAHTAAPTTLPATAPIVAGGTAPAAAPAPSSASPDVATPAAPAPAPAPAWQQVAHAVRSVDRGSDGSHRMTVRLDPPELGTVDIEVRVHEGRLSVHATSDSAPTRDLIGRALPELRAALESSGLSTGSLDVGARSTGNGANTHDGHAARGSARESIDHRGDIKDSERPTDDRAAATPNRLDLRL